jgi:hypothetical protein
MRRRGLVCVGLVLFGLVPIGGALSQPRMSDTAPLIVCTAPAASSYDNGSANSVGGRCKRGKRVVPSTVFYMYTYADSSGAGCGTVTGKGRSFGIDPTPAAVRSRFGVAPNIQPTRVTWGRWSSSSPGGDSWRCGKILNLPSVAQLCPWTTPIGTRFDSNCGKRTGAVAWDSSPTISGNTVSAGHVVSRSGACYLTSGTAGGLLNTPAPSFTWLGFTDQAMTLVCSDRVIAHGGIAYVELVNPAGQRCWGAPTHLGAWSFQIPPSWGGTLYVYFDIGVATDLATDSKSGNGPIQETGVLPLSGTADGCYQLEPGWHP